MVHSTIKRDAPFVAGETAILLVDMQRIWLEPGLDPSHPERDADHYFIKQTSGVTIPNNEKLLAAARANGVEVLHTIIQSLTEDGRDCSLDHKMTPIHVAPSRPEGLPVTSSGVFNSTNIDYVLKNLNVRYLIITGIMTDQCVDMAVRDAADRGYLVTCVSDACASATPERHDGALKAFGGYCWQADTQTVVERFNQMGKQS
jgi:nicotinamidase-related amidase